MERFEGFNMRHFHEFAQADLSLVRGHNWTRLVLLRAGVEEPSNGGGGR